jgi:hypothetical protein
MSSVSLVSLLWPHQFKFASMSVYEVDPDADTLIILSGHGSNLTHGDGGYDSLLHLVNGADQAKPGELRIKASSKHLSLASTPFRKRLAQTHGHSPFVQFDGRVHVRIGGFDPTAVKIVLNILHGKASRVPKELDLETLAKVASFVDAFKCREVVEVYADRWITRLTKTLPARYDSQCGLWIFVSSVFRQPEIFRATTRLAILQSPGVVGVTGVRLPLNVTSKELASKEIRQSCHSLLL